MAIRNRQYAIRKKTSLLILFVLLGLLVTHHLLLITASAQTATPESDKVETEKDNEGEITEEEIDKIREEVEKKVEEKIESAMSQKRAFFGQVSDLFNRTIVIETTGGKKTAKIDEDCAIVDQNRKKANFEDLEIDSYLIAMGYSESEDKLLTKRVVVTPKPSELERVAIIGKVKGIKNKQLLVEPLGKDFTWQVSVETKTEITEKIDSKTKEANIGLDEIGEGTLLVVVGTSEEENEIKATRVHFLLLKEASGQ